MSEKLELEFKKRINSLQSSIETVTDESYEDLTGAVKDLKRFAKARDYVNWGMAKNKNTQNNLFHDTNVDDVSMFDFSPVTYWTDMFSNCKQLIHIVADASNATNMTRTYSNCSNTKIITLNNTSKNKTFNATFNLCRALETINGLLDFSSATAINDTVFNDCVALKNMTVAPNSIGKSITFYSCRALSPESTQSIFDGLAIVTTAQTLTLPPNLKILQSQVDSANEKGWTVAGGTVVSEEEYYG